MTTLIVPQSLSISEGEIGYGIIRMYRIFLPRELQTNPDYAVGCGLLQDKKNGIGEYTIFVEDAAPNVNDNHAIDEAHIPRGLDLDPEVQELVRARRVTRIRAFRVVEVVAAALARE